MVQYIIVTCFLCLAVFFACRYYYRQHIKSIHDSIRQIMVTPRTPSANPVTASEVQLNIDMMLLQIVRERHAEIEKLTNVDSYRKEFLTNVSHELRTPIFSIQGYLNTLLDGGLKDDNINIRYLQRASQSLDRLILLVDDLDHISKMESGEMDLELHTIDLNELATEAMTELEQLAAKHQITLSINNYTNAVVTGDKELLRRAIINLVVNSIKYGKPNGQTQITLHKVDKATQLMVADDGIGIEEKHLSRLFERFYRVDKHRARDKGGSGLGLAIVKHIVEAHHARIEVKSKIHQGTTFSITFADKV